MCPDKLRQRGGQDAATDFYCRPFSRPALDPGSEDVRARSVGSFVEKAKVMPMHECVGTPPPAFHSACHPEARVSPRTQTPSLPAERQRLTANYRLAFLSSFSTTPSLM